MSAFIFKLGVILVEIGTISDAVSDVDYALGSATVDQGAPATLCSCTDRCGSNMKYGLPVCTTQAAAIGQWCPMELSDIQVQVVKAPIVKSYGRKALGKARAGLAYLGLASQANQSTEELDAMKGGYRLCDPPMKNDLGLKKGGASFGADVEKACNNVQASGKKVYYWLMIDAPDQVHQYCIDKPHLFLPCMIKERMMDNRGGMFKNFVKNPAQSGDKEITWAELELGKECREVIQTLEGNGEEEPSTWKESSADDDINSLNGIMKEKGLPPLSSEQAESLKQDLTAQPGGGEDAASTKEVLEKALEKNLEPEVLTKFQQLKIDNPELAKEIKHRVRFDRFADESVANYREHVEENKHQYTAEPGGPGTAWWGVRVNTDEEIREYAQDRFNWYQRKHEREGADENHDSDEERAEEFHSYNTMNEDEITDDEVNTAQDEKEADDQDQEERDAGAAHALELEDIADAAMM